MCIYIIYIYEPTPRIATPLPHAASHGMPPSMWHHTEATGRARPQQLQLQATHFLLDYGAEGFEWLKSDKFHPFIDGKCLKI